MSFVKEYLSESKKIIEQIDYNQLDKIIDIISTVKKNFGRIFFLGVGGSAANASHAVNDFRKICGIECYAPTDNVSELTARANDEGFDYIFSEWLKISKLNENDLIFILSVGGGNAEKNISTNLISALDFAKKCNSNIIGILGRDGGYTTKMANEYIVIPNVNNKHITPHAESFQALLWHLIVSHPNLKINQTKWESQT